MFGEYHIHVQRGGSDEGEGGVPAASGYPVHACVFILIYRRAWTTFAASVLFHLCLSSLLPRHGDIWTIWEIIVGLQSAVDLSEHAIN